MAITISGQNNNDKILASDGVLDQISGFNVVGVMTATTFDVTTKHTANHIDVGSNIQLGNAGIITATTLIGNVTGNVNSTSNLLLQISGSEKFRVGNGGQFGIAGANYGTAGQVFTSGGSGSAPTWSTIASDKITEGNTEAEVVDTGSDGHFKVTTEGSERLRVDASGNVMIGTTDNTGYNNTSEEGIVLRGGDCIDIARSGDGQLYLNRMGSDGQHIYFNRDGAGKTAIATRNNSFCIDVAGSEKLRVDTSGDVLIGTTDDTVYNNSSGEGVVIRGGDCIDIARNNDNQLFLNRQGGDGYHIAFLRDGSYKSFISTRTNAFCIDVNGSERFRIDSSGNLLIGDSAGQIGKLSTLGTGNHISAIRHSTDASSANFLFAKYRGSRSSPTIIVDGDMIGDLAWYGYNGSSIIKAASISASASSTVDGSNMPTDLIFKTTSGNTNTERFRIASNGKVSVTGTGAMKVPAGTTGQRPGSSVTGDIRYNSTSQTLEFYTGSAWVGTNAAPSLNSITGDIYNGLSGKTLVISCNDISPTGNDVRYSNNSTGATIATDTSASTSGSNITSTIPANVYNTAAGTVIKIEVINSAGVLSSNSLTKTILASPSGGSITSAGGYRYHTFTSSGTFVNTIANLSVQYLVVAGGGGGGGNQGGGAGGAGGYRTGSATLGTGNYSASIGGGGGNGGNGNSGYGSDGGNSSFNSLTSTGGGGGANMNTGAQTVNGRSGGSGGGASHWLNGNGSGGSGTSGQGNNGGGALDTEGLGHNGGGGGGAGASGSNGQGAYGGNGGNGSTWLNGTTYAGGGGGGCYYNQNSGGASYSIGGGAGTGGGGRGSRNVGSQLSTNFTSPTTNQNGVDGYGGGGGGGGNNPGDGGDGVVIIRYQL